MFELGATPARDRSNRVVAGVCAGIAARLEVDPTLVRLLFALLTLAGGAGIVLYLAAALLMPPEADGRTRGARARTPRAHGRRRAERPRASRVRPGCGGARGGGCVPALAARASARGKRAPRGRGRRTPDGRRRVAGRAGAHARGARGGAVSRRRPMGVADGAGTRRRTYAAHPLR